MADPPTIVIGALTPVGVVQYNLFTFPAPIAVNVVASPRYNADGRTIKSTKLTVTIQSPIVSETAGTSTDTVMSALRTRLLTPGKNLRIEGIGAGNISVGPDLTRDTNYGPKPISFQWKPIGSSQACMTVFTIECEIRDCQAATSGSLIDFSYSVTWMIDKRGLTVRSISGSAEVSAYITANRSSANADAYREEIDSNFPQPAGFDRTRTFNLSPDRKTLTFQYTDTQIPTDLPYPEKTTEIQVSHNASSSTLTLAKWINTLTGRIELKPGTPRIEAWKIFLQILSQRRQASKLGSFTSEGRGTGSGYGSNEDTFTILNSVSISEDLFGYGLSFAVSWTLTCNLTSFAKASGLFNKYPDYNWQAWLQSTQQGPRGIAGMGASSSGDYIIACDQQSGGSLSSSASNTLPTPDPTATLSSEKPSPGNSWLIFHCMVKIITEGGEIMHRKLIQTGEDLPVGTPTPNTEAPPTAIPSGGSASVNSTTQTRTGQFFKAIIYGSAKRAGYPIPPFFITSIGGKKPVLVKREYTPTQSRDAGGHPIFAATWEYEYNVEGTPSEDLQLSTNGGLMIANPTAFGG